MNYTLLAKTKSVCFLLSQFLGNFLPYCTGRAAFQTVHARSRFIIVQAFSLSTRAHRRKEGHLINTLIIVCFVNVTIQKCFSVTNHTDRAVLSNGSFYNMASSLSALFL